MTFRTESHDYFELPNGIEVELPITPEDWLQDSVEVAERPDGGFRVAYLVHDDNCENPLTYCDGMGKIWHHPRSHYAERDTEYYSVCGLDNYGSPIIDEDQLQKMWHNRVMAIPPERFTLPEEFADQTWEPKPIYSSKGEPVPYWITLRRWLADESVADTTLREQCRYAWRNNLTDEAIEAILKQIEDDFTWNYETAAEECQQPMSEYAYLLDVYDHSGRAYSLSGGGMQCRFDTSRGEAVWIADDYAREEIDHRAKVYAFGKVVKREFRSRTTYAAVVDPLTTKFLTESGGEIGDYNGWSEAFKALALYVSNFGDPTDEQKERGHQRALHEIAESCISEFDSWQQGECYGVVCVDYDAKGEQLGEDDSCWGYVGTEYAESVRDEHLSGLRNKETEHVN